MPPRAPQSGQQRHRNRRLAIGTLRMSRSYIFGISIAWTSVASFWAAAMSSDTTTNGRALLSARAAARVG